MNIKKLSLGVLAVAAIAITSIYLARQAGVLNAAGNPQTDAPQVVAKVETNSDIAAGVGREGALKKLGRLGEGIKEKVSDILDTKIIHNSPESAELERRSKAEIELAAKKSALEAMKKIRKISEDVRFQRIEGPIQVQFLSYEAKKTPADDLQYSAIVKLHYKILRNESGDDAFYYDNHMVVVGIKHPVINSSGELSYGDFDSTLWIKHAQNINLAQSEVLPRMKKAYFN